MVRRALILDSRLSNYPSETTCLSGKGASHTASSSIRQQRRTFNLGEQSRHCQGGRTDCRPRREAVQVSEILILHFHEELQVAHIGMVRHHIHDIVERDSGLSQHFLNVLERLDELRLFAFNDIQILVSANLTGDIEKAQLSLRLNNETAHGYFSYPSEPQILVSACVRSSSSLNVAFCSCVV